jgi:hypothetical protein
MLQDDVQIEFGVEILDLDLEMRCMGYVADPRIWS